MRVVFELLKSAAYGDSSLRSVATARIEESAVSLAMGEVEAHMRLQSCAREDKRVFHTTSDSILRSRQVLVFTIEENVCSSWLFLLLAGCNEGAVVIGSTRTFAEGTLERTRQNATTEKDISRNTQSTFVGREFLMAIEREQIVQLFALEPLP